MKKILFRGKMTTTSHFYEVFRQSSSFFHIPESSNICLLLCPGFFSCKREYYIEMGILNFGQNSTYTCGRNGYYFNIQI